MKINRLSDDGVLIRLESDGEIRLSDMGPDGNPIEAALGREGFGKKVLLDLQRTPYIDSSGVALLIRCHKKCQDAGGQLIMHSIPPSIMQILKLLHMERHLFLVDDEPSAQALALGEQP
jgi:anti-anti-sigma factor